MSSRHNPLNSRGDTLIEVLLAIGIVAALLGGAYLSANKSYNGTQIAKERDLALRVAETQLERIRGYKSRTTNPINDNSCVDATLTVINNSSSIPALNVDNPDGTATAGTYSVGCILDSTSAQYSAASDSIAYHVFNQVSANNYTVHVRWLRSGGGEHQETTMNYRAY